MATPNADDPEHMQWLEKCAGSRIVVIDDSRCKRTSLLMRPWHRLQAGNPSLEPETLSVRMSQQQAMAEAISNPSEIAELINPLFDFGSARTKNGLRAALFLRVYAYNFGHRLYTDARAILGIEYTESAKLESRRSRFRQLGRLM